MAKKAKEAFRTISEVADWLDVPAHVLRFWESKFPQIKPVKRAGGRRYYRPSDMLLIGGIKTLLHDQGITIRGVQLKLKEDGIATVSEMSQPIGLSEPEPKVKTVKSKPTPVTETEPVDDGAPFIEAPEDTATGGDNVVSMSRRERRRAELEDQASDIEAEEPVREEISENDEPPSEEHAPEPELAKAQAADPVEEIASEPSPVSIAEPVKPEPAAQPQAAPASNPDFSKVDASADRRESLATIGKLRRWNPANTDNREQIQYLEHRARTLRDRMAAALKSS
jgi:DNA-binding transcriptional MerR regulator